MKTKQEKINAFQEPTTDRQKFVRDVTDEINEILEERIKGSKFSDIQEYCNALVSIMTTIICDITGNLQVYTEENSQQLFKRLYVDFIDLTLEHRDEEYKKSQN